MHGQNHIKKGEIVSVFRSLFASLRTGGSFKR